MKKDTEQLILQTARKHFVQNGYAATRTQEIADEAGINKAMLHYYFRSKEKLYAEVVIQLLNTLIPRMSKAFDSEGSFYERLEIVIDAYIDLLAEQPDIPFFIMTEISQQQERFVNELKSRAAHFPAIKGFLAQMMKDMQDGLVKPMPPHHLFLNILGMTIFPFIVKPMFNTIFSYSDDSFKALMAERKTVILQFVKDALKVT